jgi:cytoskeletal protein CcmA (bactofilin family)
MLKNSFLGRRDEPATKSFDSRATPESPRYPPQQDAAPLAAVAVSTSRDIAATGAATNAAKSTTTQPESKVMVSTSTETSIATGTGPRLTVGPNIKLKGAEINDCDTLVVEGHVEASMDSKTLEILKSGSYEGTVSIDIAEIHGKFSGNLTARKKLIVHGTGWVTGTVRYGSLLVSEGGVVSGDVASLDATRGNDGQTNLFAGYPSSRIPGSAAGANGAGAATTTTGKAVEHARA